VLADTISRWENEIVTAVITGVTNARSESLNRIAKLEARQAYGFHSPASQRRRVRIACTRDTRRKTPRPPAKTTRTVTEGQLYPGSLRRPLSRVYMPILRVHAACVQIISAKAKGGTRGDCIHSRCRSPGTGYGHADDICDPPAD
jgi:Transposase